jgi:hypothetical protein
LTIDPRSWYMGPDAIDGEESQGKEDPLLQLRDSKSVLKSLNHPRSPEPFPQPLRSFRRLID